MTHQALQMHVLHELDRIRLNARVSMRVRGTLSEKLSLRLT